MAKAEHGRAGEGRVERNCESAQSASRRAYVPLTPPDACDIFWGELAPCEHLVQIYESEETYMEALEGFVAAGFRAGDAVIVIATAEHRASLDQRLDRYAFDLPRLRERDRYIVLDAEETIATFTPSARLEVDGWPDEDRFRGTITDLIDRARGEPVDGEAASESDARRERAPQRRVRAFGEMVAVMWGRGHSGATVRLEHLWHDLCRTEALTLLCAYPKIGFTQDAAESVRQICEAHSSVIPG